MSDSNSQKPAVEYPCPWGFKVIGNDEETVRAAMKDCLENCVREFDGMDAELRSFEFGDSRTSGGGKYVSVGVSLEVHSEDERNIVFRALADLPEVKMVL